MVALLGFGAAPVKAIQESQTEAVRTAIADASLLELAPTAAEIVRSANEKDREEITNLVVGLVGSKNPKLVLTLVEEISKTSPEMAAVVAAAASKIVPASVQEISRLAVSYAPNRAAEVAAKVSKASPEKALHIARKVIGVVPEEAHRVLEAIVVAVPSARQQIESDTTLNIVSVFSRNFNTSATSEVRRISGSNILGLANFASRPNRNPATTPPVQVGQNDVGVQARSADLQAVLVAIENTTSELDVETSSNIGVKVVQLVSEASQSQEIVKQEKDSIFANVAVFVEKTVAVAAKVADVQARNDFANNIAQTTTAAASSTLKNTTADSKTAAFSAITGGATAALVVLETKTEVTVEEIVEAKNDAETTVRAIEKVVEKASIVEKAIVAAGGTAAEVAAATAATTANITAAATAIEKVAANTTGNAGASAVDAVGVAVAEVAGDANLDTATAAVLFTFVETETIKAKDDIVADTTIADAAGKENALGSIIAEIAKATNEILKEAQAGGLTGEQIAAQVTVKAQEVSAAATDIKNSYGSP